MTWTYTGDPSVSDRDKIRFLTGDTDSTDPLLSDEEIEWALGNAGDSIYQASHDLCYALGSKFARLATSKSVGDLSLSYQNRSDAFMKQAERLLELAARREPPTPWVSPKNIQTAGMRDELGMQGHEFFTGTHDNKRL